MDPTTSLATLDPVRPRHGRTGIVTVGVGDDRHPASLVRIRRIVPSDHAGLRALYAGLSDESRRLRFFGPCSGIATSEATRFCTPDHDHREGFVAVIEIAGLADEVVGHVCVEPDGPNSAEVAIAVADDLHGRGIGRRLVERGVEWARTDGLTTLTATMLAGNPRIQRLLTGLGMPSASRAIGAGVVEIRIDLRRRGSGRPRPGGLRGGPDGRSRSAPSFARESTARTARRRRIR